MRPQGLPPRQRRLTVYNEESNRASEISMAQERPGRIEVWMEIIRQQAPVVRQHVRAWLTECRENPALIWETAAVRYAAYLLCGAILLVATSWLTAALSPLPQDASKRAATADFHVLCTNSACGRHFVIQRKFGFDRFPVTCPGCGQKSGHRARACHSAACNGRWVLPQVAGRTQKCPACGAGFD